MVAVGKNVSAYGYASTVEKDELRAERITVDGKILRTALMNEAAPAIFVALEASGLGADDQAIDAGPIWPPTSVISWRSSCSPVRWP